MKEETRRYETIKRERERERERDKREIRDCSQDQPATASLFSLSTMYFSFYPYKACLVIADEFPTLDSSMYFSLQLMPRQSINHLPPYSDISVYTYYVSALEFVIDNKM